MKGLFRAALFPLIVIARLVYLASQTLLGKQRSEACRFSTREAISEPRPSPAARPRLCAPCRRGGRTS